MLLTSDNILKSATLNVVHFVGDTEGEDSQKNIWIIWQPRTKKLFTIIRNKDWTATKCLTDFAPKNELLFILSQIPFHMYCPLSSAVPDSAMSNLKTVWATPPTIEKAEHCPGQHWIKSYYCAGARIDKAEHYPRKRCVKKRAVPDSAKSNMNNVWGNDG